MPRGMNWNGNSLRYLPTRAVLGSWEASSKNLLANLSCDPGLPKIEQNLPIKSPQMPKSPFLLKVKNFLAGTSHPFSPLSSIYGPKTSFEKGIKLDKKLKTLALY